MPDLRLYSYFRSSSAWRVRIALALKGLPFELVPVHLVRGGGEQLTPAYRAKNPLAQVPLLEVIEREGSAAGGGGSREGDVAFRLTQSIAILEYLEERFAEPALLPRDPSSRARVRELTELVNSGIQPLQNIALRKHLYRAGLEPEPLVRELVSAGLGALESHAMRSAGRHLVGDSVTFADIVLVPQLYASRRLELDLTPFPTLLRVEETCSALPAFQAAAPNAQPDYEPEP